MKYPDKMIEEMANDIAEICPDLVENSCCEDDSCVSCLTYSLLNKGYRLASDVAREIFGDLLDLIAEDTDIYDKCASRLVSSDYSNGRSEAIGTFIGFINELKKKYTEGEE